MLIKQWFVSFIRLTLQLHSLLHVFEAIAAYHEGAYITLGIVVFAGSAQFFGALLIPDEHIHIGRPWSKTMHTHKKKHKH
jgi:hypothetical protein